MADSPRDVDAAILLVFSDRDALSPRTAKTAQELGLTQDAALGALIERRLVRRAPGDEGRLYVPLLSRSLSVPSWARKASQIAFVGIVVLAVVVVVFAMRR